MRRPRPRRGIVLGLVLLVAGCERRAGVVEDDGKTWHARSHEPVGLTPWPTLELREFVVVDLPEARNAQLEADVADAEAPPFFLNLTADGKVQFKGNTYDIADGWDVVHRAVDIEDRPWTVAGMLHEFLRQAAPRWRDADGASRMTFVLQADRAARWHWIPSLWRLLLLDDVRISRLHIEVARPGKGPGRLLTRITAVHDATTGKTIRMERGHASDGPGDTAVRFDVAGTIVTVPDVAALQGPGGLAEANAAWEKVAAVLRPLAASEGAVAIRPDAFVPFGHVVTLLDVLLSAGVRAVEFPDQAVRMELEPPAPPKPHPPTRDHGVSLPGVLAVILGGALLAFAATAIPLRRTRRG